MTNIVSTFLFVSICLGFYRPNYFVHAFYYFVLFSTRCQVSIESQKVIYLRLKIYNTKQNIDVRKVAVERTQCLNIFVRKGLSRPIGLIVNTFYCCVKVLNHSQTVIYLRHKIYNGQKI